MKLICIGIGGTGAACVETTLHLAALGLLPGDCEVVPVALDPDRQHPRIAGLTRFLNDYQVLRQEGLALDMAAGGLFGARLLRDPQVNAQRPATHESLYGLLGLANPASQPLSRLFFDQQEIGAPESHEFANGYYGRANAGVCFFSDPAGRNELLDSLRPHLLGGEARIVVFGSVFGGTGAAGMLHVARSIRQDPQLIANPPDIAIVQLESYFRPDSSGLAGAEGFVNLPETFERRTGASYQFLAYLQGNGSLPFDALYPLGVREPAVFPPEWFRKDQQDNPHLFLEYVAALAARDFALNGKAAGGNADLRLRRIALPPFSGPLAVLRHQLVAAATTFALLQRFVVPLLDRANGAGRLPGHPWIHDVLTASDLAPKALRDHLLRSLALLREILGHGGVLDSGWRLDGGAASDAQLAWAREMSARTRDSFPTEFAPHMENLTLPDLLPDADPQRLFADYDRARDGQLPVRALFRWVEATLQIPPTTERQRQDGRVDYQLVQQEDQLDESGQSLNLGNVPDDSFASMSAGHVLKRLARASWKSPPRAGARQASEYPSIWAPGLVHRETLYRPGAAEETRLVHVGLLFTALVKINGRARAPVHAFALDTHEVSPVFADVLRATCPLSSYEGAVIRGHQVVALHDHPGSLQAGAMVRPEEVLGYFYPDTALVPARGLTAARRKRLEELGRFALDRGFAGFLAARLEYRWTSLLTTSGVPTATEYGPSFITFLQSFGTKASGQPLRADELYPDFPLPGAAPWLSGLYGDGGRS